MKKTYEKPRIICEDFQVSQNIASCAMVLINARDVESCFITEIDGISLGGSQGFVESNQACNYKIPMSDYCYTNGSAFTATHIS